MPKFIKELLHDPWLGGLMGFALLLIAGLVCLILIDRRNQRKYVQWLERRRRSAKERAAKQAAMRPGP
jgi:hypothetical protein